jgi:hypothetical protein
MTAVDDDALVARFPAIAWRAPILITVAGGATGLGCRLCIARKGLHASQVKALARTQAEFERHMEREHPQ